MPKERIAVHHYPAEANALTVAPPITGPITESEWIEVIWTRDDWAQIAIVKDITNAAGTTGGRKDLHSACLTRPDINNLIRALRRARDQVHGVDA